MDSLNETLRILRLIILLGECLDNEGAYEIYESISQELIHLESQGIITKAQYTTLFDQLEMVYNI